MIEDLISEEQIILKSLDDNRQKQREFYTNEFVLRNGSESPLIAF
jgi:hypothetical protein